MSAGERLVQARERLGFSQDDAANALGVSRAMISYWEAERRRPNDRQLTALARLYKTQVGQLLGEVTSEPRADLAQVLLRSETDLPNEVRPGLEEFVSFLDRYAELATATGLDIGGMTRSPFVSRAGFDTAEDARRKAEDVRAHLRLGLGPVADLDWICELLGITVFRASLGPDLSRTMSGAFLRHPAVGFSILVNLDMTPGRRRFTIAHEIAHTLFHSDKAAYVISRAARDPRERFADAFAGEFLMPTEGIRRFMEDNGLRPRIEDPAEVVHVQRYFKVSYPTALVRLRQAKVLTAERYESFKQVRPVLLARALGYEIDEEEYDQDPELWRLARYPRRFLRMLRTAIQREVVSVPTVAELTGLPLDEIATLVGEQRGEGVAGESRTELSEYEDSGVLEPSR